MGSCVSSEDKSIMSTSHVPLAKANGYKDSLNSPAAHDKLNSSSSSAINSHRLSTDDRNHRPSTSSTTNGTNSDANNRALTSSSAANRHLNSGGSTTVIALYNYNAKDEGDLSFKKGDRLLLLSDKDDPDWWLARNLATNEKGYIPRNYVVSEALETEE